MAQTRFMLGNEDLYLVINLGFRSIRIIVFDREGNNLFHNWYPIKTQVSSGFVEQDTNEWLQRLHTLFIELTESISDITYRLKAITVTSSSNCLIPVNSQGNAIYNCILVSDTRAEKYASILAQKYTDFFKENRSFLPVASFQMPKILWFKEEEPALFNETYKFLSPNDFLMHKLTGNHSTDPLNAAKHYYNEQSSSHAVNILNDFGISPNVLPDTNPVGHVVGNLKSAICKRYGFSNEVKVVQTTYDAICAFWGSGVSQNGDASNVIGTVSSVRALSPTHIAFDSNMLSQKFSIFDKYIIGGSNNLDGGIFEWARGCFYGDSYPEKYIFNIMEDEARLSSVGSRGLFFTPYLLGERTPFWDSNVRGSFFGLEKYHTRSDFMRSIFESSCYMVKDMITDMEEHGVSINHLRLNGGASQMDLLSQLRADILGKDIYVLKEKESTSLGAFLLMMYSLGHIKSVGEFSKYAEVKKIFYPNKEVSKIYSQLHRFFKRIYNETKTISQERRDLVKNLNILNGKYTVENM